MNRTIRAIIGVVLVIIIVFCGIIITQKIGGTMRYDITEKKIYTLSPGSKAIISKLSQQVKMKLYYTKTAAMKGPDQIRFFNNYYHFVESLLKEYAAASAGKINLEIIDPRPFSTDKLMPFDMALKGYQWVKRKVFSSAWSCRRNTE